MPSPKNTSRTLAEVRAECIALGVTPGRSIAECERRIAEASPPRSMSEVAEAKAAEAPPAALLVTPHTPFSRVERNKPRASIPGGLRRRMQREGRI